MTTVWRCTNGHEYTSPKRQTQCAYGRCTGTPVAVRGPLVPRKNKTKGDD